MTWNRLSLVLATIGAFTPEAFAVGPGCPPSGPVYPPSALDMSTLRTRLAARLTATSMTAVPGIDGTLSSFSLHVNAGGKLIHSVHHTASVRNPLSVSVVDGDTYYRIASITKVFTYLSTMLADGMSPHDKIGKWLPELRSANGALAWWDGVTLLQLGTHTSGLPRENYERDFAFAAQPFLVSMGWPSMDPPEIEDCAAGDIACVKRNTLELAAQTAPDYEPGVRAAYSNLGYTLLGLAIEAATGKPYAEALQDLIFDPLDMDASTLVKPDAEKPFSSGGIYSTSNDLSLFLNNAQKKLNLFKTNIGAWNSWLSPNSFLSSNYEFVGAPWEITRLTSYTPDHRPITMYGKSGSLPSYVSILALIPEYGITSSLLIASDLPNQIETLGEFAAGIIIEEAEKVIRQGARNAYGGRWTGTSGNKTVVVEISRSEEDAAGLKVTKLESDGQDILLGLWLLFYGAPPAGNVIGRIYSSESSGLEFRLVTMLDEGVPVPEPYNGKVATCLGWYLDGFRYGGHKIDLFRFKRTAVGGITGLEIPALKASLTRSSA